jgi:DNA primase
MPAYHSAKEEIKRAADIVDLIGQFVQLKKAGRNYVGLCPFHAEKDPSFTVAPDRQTFHCFGCKKGGDVFSFWMEYHSSTFTEALRDLAERYHVTVPESSNGFPDRQKAVARAAVFKINEVATLYFQKTLNHPVKGRPARAYMAQRSLPEKTIREFRLGYAPDAWDGLVSELKGRGADLETAALAGLIVPRKSGAGFYDRFRGRITFPILDLRQQVIGFGGRVLDDSLPKYMNTPETPVFHKGESLYGLNVSHKAIREKGRAVVVEGYMDCLALRKYGFNEVIATLGTALTDRHVRRLKGYAKEAVVVFDSDSAGKQAAMKSLPVFSNEGLPARVVVLPDGHDPDSFVNANGLDRFCELIDRAAPMFDFYLEQNLAEGETDEAKAIALKKVLPVLKEIQNFVLRSFYTKRLSERIGIKEEVILAELSTASKSAPNGFREKNLRESISAPRAGKHLSDLQLVNLLIHHPSAIARLIDCEWEVLLSDPGILQIMSAFFQKYRREGSFPPESLLECLDGDSVREQYREALLSPAYYSDQAVDTAVSEFEEKIQQIKISESIQKARERGDIEGLNALLKIKAQRISRSQKA